MKFVIGKFSSEPFHALNKQALTVLFKLAPKEWMKNVSTVVLSAKVLKKTKIEQAVMYEPATNKLTILSRGLTREDTARQVLIELAVAAGEIPSINPTKASKQQNEELDVLVGAYLKKFLKSRI